MIDIYLKGKLYSVDSRGQMRQLAKSTRKHNYQSVCSNRPAIAAAMKVTRCMSRYPPSQAGSEIGHCAFKTQQDFQRHDGKKSAGATFSSGRQR